MACPWTAALIVGRVGQLMATLAPDTVSFIRTRTAAHLRTDPTGAVIATGVANAVKAIVPR